MAHLLSQAIYSVCVTSLALSVGQRTGFISVHTRKIPTATVRGAVESVLRISDYAVDAAVDLGETLSREIKKKR